MPDAAPPPRLAASLDLGKLGRLYERVTHFMIIIPIVTLTAFVLCVIQNARAGAAFSRYIREKNPPEFEPYKAPGNSASTAVFLFSSAASQLAAKDPVFARVLASCRRGCLYLPLWLVGSVIFVFVAGYFIAWWSPRP